MMLNSRIKKTLLTAAALGLLALLSATARAGMVEIAPVVTGSVEYYESGVLFPPNTPPTITYTFEGPGDDPEVGGTICNLACAPSGFFANWEDRAYWIFDLTSLGLFQSATLAFHLDGAGQELMFSEVADVGQLATLSGASGQAALGAAFADIGSGPSYVNSNLLVGAAGNYTVDLNLHALNQLNATSGLFGIGVALNPVNGIGGVAIDQVSLRLTGPMGSVAAPPVTLLMLAALLGLAYSRRFNSFRQARPASG